MFRATIRLLAAGLLLAPLSSAVRAQAPPRNVNMPGVQVLPLAPRPRLVPFQPQNANPPAVFAPAPAAVPPAIVFERQLAAVRRVQVLNVLERRQLAVLLQEQLQLMAMQEQLNSWASQPLTPFDQQQLATLQDTLTALQQQNLLQQLAILQP